MLAQKLLSYQHTRSKTERPPSIHSTATETTTEKDIGEKNALPNLPLKSNQCNSIFQQSDDNVKSVRKKTPTPMEQPHVPKFSGHPGKTFTFRSYCWDKRQWWPLRRPEFFVSSENKNHQVAYIRRFIVVVRFGASSDRGDTRRKEISEREKVSRVEKRTGGRNFQGRVRELSGFGTSARNEITQWE